MGRKGRGIARRAPLSRVQIFAGDLPAVHTEIFPAESSAGSAGENGSARKGILLRGLPLHLATGRFKTAAESATHGTVLFHRRDRADNGAFAGWGATAGGLK